MEKDQCNVCGKYVEQSDLSGYTLNDGAFDLCPECAVEADYLKNHQSFVTSDDVRGAAGYSFDDTPESE